MTSNKQGSLLVFIAVFLWSIMGFIIKTVEASATWILLIRSLSAGIFLSPFIFKEKIRPFKNVVITAALMVVFFFSYTITTQISSAAMGVGMQAAAPIYVIIYGFYKSREVSPKKVLVFLLIFIGVFLNVWNSFRASNNLAMITGLSTGICYVLYSVSLKKVETGSILGVIALINLVSSVILLTILPFTQASPPASLNDVLLLVFAGVVVSGLSYAAYGAGLRKISIERAMIIGLAEPVLNPIWVFLGNGEIPEPSIIIGLVFIILGALADILFRARSQE